MTRPHRSGTTPLTPARGSRRALTSRQMFISGIGLFGLLAGFTALMWLLDGTLHTPYVFVMIPVSAIAVICIFGGFLLLLLAEVKQIGGRLDSHEKRINGHDERLKNHDRKFADALRQLAAMNAFLREQHGYATGFVTGAVSSESPELGSVLSISDRPRGKRDPKKR